MKTEVQKLRALQSTLYRLVKFTLRGEYGLLLQTDSACWSYVVEMSGEGAWYPPDALGVVFRLLEPPN